MTKVKPAPRTAGLAAVALLAALLYLFVPPFTSAPLGLVVKPLPVLCMALWVAGRPDKTRFEGALIAGLLLSALGDVLLSLPADAFVPGLLAFLAAHLAYIVAFTQDSRAPYPGRALLAYGYGAGMFAVLFLAGDLGGLAIPVLLYVLVICTMLWRAAARVEVPDIARVSALAGLIGAALFAASDSYLALNRFVTAMPAAGLIIMLTYWAGQLGITLSAWKRRATDNTNPSRTGR